MNNQTNKSIMLNQIIKKLTSTNISNIKLQQIAKILGIKTPDDSKFLSQIKADQELEEIKLKDDMALLKSLPKPTNENSAHTHTNAVIKTQSDWVKLDMFRSMRKNIISLIKIH